MSKAGSLNKILETCNRVREAGGTNPLDALMPAVPENPEECLIARNLNFECNVAAPCYNKYGDAIHYPDGDEAWFMQIADPDTLDNISKSLGWRKCYTDRGLSRDSGQPDAVVLPQYMGNAANEFDNTAREIKSHGRMATLDEFKKTNLWKKYGPYIEEELSLKAA